MEEKSQSFEERMVDLISAQSLALTEIAIALHEANVIDKSLISDRWRAASTIESSQVTPGMRKFLELIANLVDRSEGSK